MLHFNVGVCRSPNFESMASGGHPHPTLTMHPSYSGEEASSSSPLAVWTAQVPALSANGINGSDLCWQMVENGQQAVQLQRRRNGQKLFHLGRTLLLKHLPRDVNEHVSDIKKKKTRCMQKMSHPVSPFFFSFLPYFSLVWGLRPWGHHLDPRGAPGKLL